MTHRLTFLFSGHMIDGADTLRSRFPPACEANAAVAIDAQLSRLGAGPEDLGITQGACGADILFAESMLKRGARLYLLLPLVEEQFIAASIAFEKAPSPIPDRWLERYTALRQNPRTEAHVASQDQLPDEPSDPFARCNLRMLTLALGFGAPRLRFVCFAEDEVGGKPGGTAEMRTRVREAGGDEYRIDVGQVCAGLK